MIVRNEFSGALHEVPDNQLFEVGEQVYDPSIQGIVKFQIFFRNLRSGCRSSFGRDFRSLDKSLPVGFDRRFPIQESNQDACICGARRGAVIPDMCRLLQRTRCPGIQECPECIHQEYPACRECPECPECLECLECLACLA